MKPVKAKGLWKYETDSLRLFQGGAVLIYDPDTDSRSGITGTQNRIIFRGLKFQSQAERVNVIFPQSDINDNEQVVRWVPKKSTTLIDDVGGISDSDTSVIVNKPANAALFTPDTKRIWAVKIENEFIVITSVASSVPDGSHDTWTIKRGRHGTTAAAHGDGNTCRLYATEPDMGVIALTSSNVALDVPSALSATAYAGYIDVAWTHGLTDTQIKQLHSFILYYSDSTIAVFDPNVDSLPGGVTRLELSKSPRHIFADQTYIKKYCKVTSMNLSGVESALSSEVSATAPQPPLPVVNAKPDPPIIGMAGNGGSQGAGFNLLVAVQISGSPGDAGVTKLQYQIGDFDAAFNATGGDPPTGGFTSNRTPSHAGVDIDKVEAGHEFVGPVIVPLSSAASGGKYQLTARVFNGSGGGWSDWATPVTSSTIGGLPDQGAPGSTGAVFKALDTPHTDGGAGNNVTFELGLPSSGANTVYGFQIQGADATGDWTSTVQGQLSLLDIVELGTGDIVDGGIVINNLSVGLTASAHVGEVVFVYESVVVSGVGEGKITGIAGLNLITANSTTSITVKPHGGVGYKKTATGIGFFISSGFNHYDFHSLDQLLPQFGGIAEQVGHLYRISFQISKALFYRMRWLGPETHGEWFYVKSGTDGTTNKATATKFTPSKLVASQVVSPLSITNTEIASNTIDLGNKSVNNSLAALQLASELKPPTVSTGTPSGAPSATEGPWYLQSNTTPTTLFFWTGSVWTTNRALWTDAAIANASIVAGTASIGAISAAAMIVDGILSAKHLVAGGLTLLSGQDITFITSDTNPTELIFGTHHKIISDETGLGGGGGLAETLYLQPQADFGKYLYLGTNSLRWEQIVGLASSVSLNSQDGDDTDHVANLFLARISHDTEKSVGTHVV